MEIQERSVQELINLNPALITKSSYQDVYFENTLDGLAKTTINRTQEQIRGVFIREYTNNIIDIYV